MATTEPPNEAGASQADAGNTFVLESKGTWLHAGYHLTSATAGPPLLALPFAMSSLGWAPGIFTLLLAAAITFYACFLISITTEELNARGFKCFRFWDVASHVMGISSAAPPKDYSVHGSPVHVMFGTFNAVSIMITAYANPMIVEIQATLLPPPTGKMLKGLLICYSVSLLTFFSVAISGYWAFGSSAKGLVFDNMEPFVPKWLFILSNAFACLQLIVTTAVYLQPLFAKYEGLVIDVDAGRFSAHNALLRLVGRSLFVLVAILIAAMLPFFADFSALMGAFGFVPLCIILPCVFHSAVFRDKLFRFRFLHAVNVIIIAVCLVVTIVGTVAALRQIVLDINTYRIFPST